MGIFYFPSEFVFWTKNMRHGDMKPFLTTMVEKIEKHHENNQWGVENGFTSYNSKNDDVHTTFLNEKTLLKHVVFDPIEEMIQTYNSGGTSVQLNIDKCVVDAAWYTKYKVGGTFDYHTHDDYCTKIDGTLFKPAISIIYILNDTNEKNTTEFFVPYTKHSMYYFSEFRFDTGTVSDIGEGTVIVFPSSLYHRVLPCIKPGRIVISYNVKCSFKN
jgi:hypothetical protein